jgi:hypothetical protein
MALWVALLPLFLSLRWSVYVLLSAPLLPGAVIFGIIVILV